MTESSPIWVIDDDHAIRWVLEKALKQAGMNVQSFDNANGILERLEHETPSAILTDIRMPGVDGLQLLEQINEKAAGDHHDRPLGSGQRRLRLPGRRL